jgi:hypothetical protein
VAPFLSRRSLWEANQGSSLSWGHIILSHPGDKFQLIIVVLEVDNYGEPSQSTKPTVTYLQFQPINPRHKVCKCYSVTRCEGWNSNFQLCQRLYCGLLLPLAGGLRPLVARYNSLW